MSIHTSSVALKAELESPSVAKGSRQNIATIIKTQRPAMLPLLEQVSVIEALIFAANEDEENEKVHGKYENARQTMVALRRHVQNIDDHQHKLSTSLKNWETQKVDILRVMVEEE